MSETGDDMYDAVMRRECRYGFSGEMHLPDGRCPSGERDCWKLDDDEETSWRDRQRGGTKEPRMPKPTTVKLTGRFEMQDTVSLRQLHETLDAIQALAEKGIGPGLVTFKIGRQELRA